MKSQTNRARTRFFVAWLTPIVFAQGQILPCAATDHGKWGYIRKDGIFAIKPQFDFAQSFIFQNVYVRVGRAYRVIDKNGELLPKLKTAIPPSPDTDYGVSPVVRESLK